MRPSNTTELLSAFLDDELRPEEKRRVESILGESPAARAELEGLRRVSLGVRRLERQAPPPTLDLATVRRLALLQQEPSLLDRFEDNLPGSSRQSSLLLLFSLIVVYSLAIYGYSVWKWQDPRTLLPVVLDPPPEIKPVARPEYDKGHTAFVSGKIFVREHRTWYQEGFGPRTPARPVALDGGEGRRLLARRPDLRGITQLGEVVLEVDGEVLCLIPADRPLGGL